MARHQLLSTTVLILGMVSSAYACCGVCLWCSKGVIKPNQLLNGEGGALSIITEEMGLLDTWQIKYEEGSIAPGTFLAICDASDDDVLDWKEFAACLNNQDTDLKESFETLDANHDGRLRLQELKKFAVSMTESGDCYADLYTHCTAQYVMYERVRGLSRNSLCGGFEMYFECVNKGAAKCEDPRIDKLQAIFKWTLQKLKPICDKESSSPRLTPTMSCSVGLVRSLQGSEPPCVALANFNDCLLSNTEAKEGESPFEEVVKMAGCNQNANENTDKRMGHHSWFFG